MNLIDQAALRILPSIRNGADAREVVLQFLSALRDPSEGMLGATDSISLEANLENSRRATWFWQAMIDAALAEANAPSD